MNRHRERGGGGALTPSFHDPDLIMSLRARNVSIQLDSPSDHVMICKEGRKLINKAARGYIPVLRKRRLALLIREYADRNDRFFEGAGAVFRVDGHASDFIPKDLYPHWLPRFEL